MQQNNQWKRNKYEGIEKIKIKMSDDLVQDCLRLASTKKDALFIRGLFSSTNIFPDKLCKGVLDVHKTLMASKENFR